MCSFCARLSPPFLLLFSSHTQHSVRARLCVRAGSLHSVGTVFSSCSSVSKSVACLWDCFQHDFDICFLDGFTGWCWLVCTVFAGTAPGAGPQETAHLSAEPVLGLPSTHHCGLSSTCLPGLLSQPVPILDHSLVPRMTHCPWSVSLLVLHPQLRPLPVRA